MTNHNKQKAAEKRLFKEFLKLHPFPHNSSINYDDSPDVLVAMPDGRIIGVEIAGLYESNEAMELENIKAWIVEEAKRICVDKGCTDIIVRVTFPGSFALPNDQYGVESLRAKDKSRISEDLATFILQESANLDNLEKRKFKPRKERPGISIRRNSNIGPDHIHWTIDNASFVNRSAVENIQSAINKKNAKIEGYREKCNECWLLLVAERRNPAQRFELDDESRAFAYKSTFDRVYYLEVTDGYLIELNLAQ